jgi:uncharacterized membrane protein
MATEAPQNAEPTLVQLIGGLVGDARDLLLQELALARHEVKQEVREAKAAMLSFGVGIAVGGIGVVLLALMLVHLLQVTTRLPYWAAYGVVSALCLVIAGIALAVARRRAADIDMVPEETVQTVKENVQWIRQSATSDKTWNKPVPH